MYIIHKSSLNIKLKANQQVCIMEENLRTINILLFRDINSKIRINLIKIKTSDLIIHINIKIGSNLCHEDIKINLFFSIIGKIRKTQK